MKIIIILVALAATINPFMVDDIATYVRARLRRKRNRKKYLD